MQPQPDAPTRPEKHDAGLCPRCGAGYAQRSRRKGLKDRLASALGLRPYRCWVCNRRFYLRLTDGTSHRGGQPLAPVAALMRNWRILLFCFTLLVLVALLYFIAHRPR